MASSPRILVVADSGDGDVIRSRLGEREITDVQVSPGNDDTLEAYLASPPDIVVLRATLSAGDALSFVGALRDGVDIVPGIVLVGDKDGPVQTALDAMEFKADRFLRWPPDASALAFAVNSCLELNKDFEKPPSTVGGVARVAELSMGVGNADVADVDTARDDEEGDDIDPRDLSQAGVAMFAESSRSENLLNGFFDDAVQDLIRAQVDSMLEAAVSDLRDNDAVAPPDRPRREPTQILSGPVPTTPPDAILDEEDASAEMDSGELPTRGGGTIVRELRQKMSDIEQRLFGEVGLGSEDTAPAPDIDLDSVVEETDSEHQRTELFVSGEVDTEAGTVSADEAATVIRPPTERGQRGDLAEDPPAELLARLWRQRYVGRASFRQNEAHRVLVFEAGRPVFATSNVVQDRMGDLLYREGKITRTQYAESRHMVAKTGRRMGEILVEMGFLKRRELLPAVRRHLEDVVYSLFAWETGEWATHPGEATGSEKIRLATPPAALIFEGIRRKLPLDRLQRRLGPASTVVVPLPDSEGRTAVDVLAREVHFSGEEQQVLARFDGRASLADVGARSVASLTEVYQLAYALVALGWARIEEERHGTFDTGPRQDSSPRLVGVADTRIDRERIMAKYDHARRADYFTVLGVKRDATAFEIRRAYESVRRDYSPEGYSDELKEELGAPLGEIGEVVDEAYHVLRNDGLRKRYLNHLVD